MNQQDSLSVSDLSTDEQVVSYLLDMRTRTFKFVLSVIEAIDMLQDAKADIQTLVNATKANQRSHALSRLPSSIGIDSITDWNSKITTADQQLHIAAQCTHELRAIVHAFAGDNCSLKVRKAVRDAKASQTQLENKLRFSRSLVAELKRLKDELLSVATMA